MPGTKNLKEQAAVCEFLISGGAGAHHGLIELYEFYQQRMLFRICDEWGSRLKYMQEHPPADPMTEEYKGVLDDMRKAELQRWDAELARDWWGNVDREAEAPEGDGAIVENIEVKLGLEPTKRRWASYSARIRSLIDGCLMCLQKQLVSLGLFAAATEYFSGLHSEGDLWVALGTLPGPRVDEILARMAEERDKLLAAIRAVSKHLQAETGITKKQLLKYAKGLAARKGVKAPKSQAAIKDWLDKAGIERINDRAGPNDSTKARYNEGPARKAIRAELEKKPKIRK